MLLLYSSVGRSGDLACYCCTVGLDDLAILRAAAVSVQCTLGWDDLEVLRAAVQ